VDRRWPRAPRAGPLRTSPAPGPPRRPPARAGAPVRASNPERGQSEREVRWLPLSGAERMPCRPCAGPGSVTAISVGESKAKGQGRDRQSDEIRREPTSLDTLRPAQSLDEELCPIDCGLRLNRCVCRVPAILSSQGRLFNRLSGRPRFSASSSLGAASPGSFCSSTTGPARGGQARRENVFRNAWRSLRSSGRVVASAC
jgi:hypothetical protein